MPEAGGLLDQGACYPEVMAAVEAGMNAAQTLKQEIANRDREKKMRANAAGAGHKGRSK